MTEPTKEQTEQMMDRMAKGMTTVEDSDLMRKWICMLWEAQRERMFGTPLCDQEEAHWKEHAERIGKEADQ